MFHFTFRGVRRVDKLSRCLFSSLKNISPLDGRYAKSTQTLQHYFSEYALIKYRTKVEIEWLKFLINNRIAGNQNGEDLQFITEDLERLSSIADDFDERAANRVKEIESVTNHDVKAVEYYIKEQLDRCILVNLIKDPQLADLKEYVHFLCTSEDINNLSYALMMSDANTKVVAPELEGIVHRLSDLAEKNAHLPMLARTHGQTASPTTVGKEMANFAYRINQPLKLMKGTKFHGKLNGAVGNFNAHIYCYPEYDWPSLSQNFIQGLGLGYNPYTTQIEPHDQLGLYYSYLSLANTILIGYCRDMWGYISIGYFKQKAKQGEVGSSTMPHKVNPIDFENCEGSLGLSNSLALHFMQKLPISRYQRDLSDSTVMRNHGVSLGYALVGWKSLQKGLDRIEPNKENLEKDLENHWEILAEPIQQLMRKHGMENPYEKLKDLTRGSKVDQMKLQHFIQGLTLPEDELKRSVNLQPKNYTGNAAQMAEDIKKHL